MESAKLVCRVLFSPYAFGLWEWQPQVVGVGQGR